MLTEIYAILRKEWKEMLMMRGSLRGGLTNLLVIVGVFGIVVPLQSAKDWFVSPLLPIVWSWMPVFMTTWMVADSVAGERERHTLDTLLASRLSDRAILFGKLAASVLYGFGLALANLLLAAVTVNVARFGEGLRFYPPEFFVLLLAFSFLGCGLLAGLGVLVSLRAATARQAYQRLSIVMVVVWVLPTVALPLLPAGWLASVDTLLTNANYNAILGMVCLVLLALDAMVVSISMARFTRAKLALE